MNRPLRAFGRFWRAVVPPPFDDVELLRALVVALPWLAIGAYFAWRTFHG